MHADRRNARDFAGDHAGPASARERLRVTVALVPDSDPVAGEIDVDGTILSFSGWMELTALLDQARADRPPPRS